MKNLIFSILLVLVSSSAIYSQNDYSAHQQTTTPTDARYEILQSEIAVKVTYRLDRYTGRVWRMFKDDGDGLLYWSELDVQYLPEIEHPTKPRFILFTSGIVVRHTFLMDTETGSTWQAYQDTNDGSYFFDRI